MFEWLQFTPAGRLLVCAGFIALVYVILLTTVLGILALAARRAGPPDLYRIGPVVFRFRRIRFRLRLWQVMVAIGALGALFESGILARHASYAYRKAEDHTISAATHNSEPDLLRLFTGKPVDPWFLAYSEAEERFHEQMSQKYFDVARHPWRPVFPDPPEPVLTEHLLRAMTSPEGQWTQ